MEFQGILDDESPFSKISAEFPGVKLESKLPTNAVEDVAEPTADEQANTACQNADIDLQEFQRNVVIEADPTKVEDQRRMPDNLFDNIQLPNKIAGVDTTRI